MIDKKNIYKIEDKIEALKPLLISIENDDDERLIEVRHKSSEIISNVVYSMRCSKTYNFFSLLMDKMDIEYDYHLKAPMAVTFQRNHFIMLINPFLVFSGAFDKFQIRAMIVHEGYHVLMKHILRANKYLKSGEYTHETINIGLDTAINQYIPEFASDPAYCNLKSYANFTNIPEYKILPHQNCEYYIEGLKNSEMNQNGLQAQQMIQEMLDNFNKQMENQNGNSSDDNQDESNSNGQEQNNQESSGNKVNKSIDSLNDLDKMLSRIKEGDADIQDHVTNELIKDISNKCRGKIPDSLSKIIEEINTEPIIRWQDVLRNYIGRIPIPFKKTRSRLSRRTPERLDIMGKLPDAFYNIVIAIDTSGSMSDSDVQLCFSEIWHIIESQKKRFDITVIECDAEIQKMYFVKKKSDFKNISNKRYGYGGTSFSPVFNYLRENSKKYRNAVTIYFTDGYGEFELENKPLNYNNIWVLTTNNNCLSLKKSYGRVLTTNIEEIRKKYNM